MARGRMHYVAHAPRALCGVSDQESDGRFTGMLSEFYADTLKCRTCTRKLVPTAVQLDLLSYLARGGDVATWEIDARSGVIAFYAREKVIEALANRGWVSDNEITPEGRAIVAAHC